MDSPNDVPTTLGSLQISSSKEPSLEASNSSEPAKFKYIEMKVGEKRCVRVQSGETVYDFYVADVYDHRRYMKERYDFAMYCINQPLQDVAAAAVYGRCCCVKVNRIQQFERAIVEKVTEPGEKAIVKLVDTGKKMEVNYNRIRCLTSPTYTTQPAIAIHCTADEDQVWVTDLPDFLHPGHQFVIKILELGNGTDIPHKVNIFPLVPID